MAETPGMVIWRWREQAAAGGGAGTVRHLRRQGLLQGAVLVAIAVVLRFGLHRALPADIVVTLGAAQLLLAIWRPEWLGPLVRLGVRLGQAVGTGLTWLLLVPFFVVFIVPAGLILRARGRDPLARRALEPGLTGWIPRRRESPAESLKRQFLDEDRAARSLRRPVEAPPAPGDAGRSGRP